MRRRPLLLLPVLAVLACGDEAPATPAARKLDPIEAPVAPSPGPTPPIPTPPSPTPSIPVADPIPGLLLEKLQVSGEGHFTLPDGVVELEPLAAVSLGEGLALVGRAHARAEEPTGPRTWRWIGFVPRTDSESDTISMTIGEGSIEAAIADGRGGALLVGHIGSGDEARGWFGALSPAGTVQLDIPLDGEAPPVMTDILLGHGGAEKAIVLGNLGGQGWVASVDARGGLRWQTHVSGSGVVQLHAAARLHVERGDVLVVGEHVDPVGQAWWSTVAGDGHVGTPLQHGTFSIVSAQRERTLDAIVDLGDTGLLALGRARRERVQEHDQVIAVGFDRKGAPTWSRVLEHFRAIEILDGAANPKMLGVANFVVRVPIAGDEGESALAWLDICPGMDGILIERQLSGTIDWSSAGFVEGGEDTGILAYRQTATGVDWRMLPLHANFRAGWKN